MLREIFAYKRRQPNFLFSQVHHVYSSLGAGKFYTDLFINKRHKMTCSMGKEMFEQELPVWRKWILEQRPLFTLPYRSGCLKAF